MSVHSTVSVDRQRQHRPGEIQRQFQRKRQSVFRQLGMGFGCHFWSIDLERYIRRAFESCRHFGSKSEIVEEFPLEEITSLLASSISGSAGRVSVCSWTIPRLTPFESRFFQEKYDLFASQKPFWTGRKNPNFASKSILMILVQHPYSLIIQQLTNQPARL